jgi:hypothetical protein
MVAERPRALLRRNTCRRTASADDDRGRDDGARVYGRVAASAFRRTFTIQTATRGYDVTADGQRFLMVQPKDRPPVRATQMIYVQNWFEELRRRVSAK